MCCLRKQSLSWLEAAEDAGAEVVVVAAVEVARSVAVVAEAQAARVEWEEADALVDPAAGLQFLVEAIAQVEARPGTCRDPAATARVVWLRTRMSPAETSTDPKLLPRSNLVRKALGPPCLRLLRGIEPEPERRATEGSLMLRTKLAAANSRGELKELGAASSVRWRGAQWRVPVSQILVEAIWGVEATLGAEAIWGVEAIWGGRGDFSPERNQAIANRQQYWDKWSGDNQGKLADFRTNRSKDWSNINNFRKNENVAGRFNSSEWNNYRGNVNNFRNNRATEINNNIQNNFDNNFDDNWWGNCGWYGGGYYGGNPWWWWGATTLATAGTFLAIDAIQAATYQPPVYDYGVNVVYQGDYVYVDGKRTASATEYANQAIALANEPAVQPPAPGPPESGKQPDWLPLGVWALAQEEKGDAYMFFQLSIDKDGVVSGAYQNALSGEKSPISGQVDKKTQRVAWRIGTNNTVIETGLQNLTQDVASCLVHFGPDKTQTWLLVRLKQPEMPTAAQAEEAETKGS